MRIGGGQRVEDFEINVISLIDVMLTLLMFFVMTTTFVQHSQLKVALPEASDAAQTQTKNTLIIIIDRDGHYFVDNNEVLRPGRDSLKEAIAPVLGEDHDRPVTLRADALTPHQAVVTAMDVLGQLGVVHLSIATTPSKEPARK